MRRALRGPLIVRRGASSPPRAKRATARARQAKPHPRPGGAGVPGDTYQGLGTK